MGLCATKSIDSLDDDKKNNKSNKAHKVNEDIEAKSLQAQKDNSKIFKLLLLGTGESGKSTFLKQFTMIFGPGFTEEKLKTYAEVVVSNVFDFMQAILRYVDSLEKRTGKVLIPVALDRQRRHVQSFRTDGSYYIEPALGEAVRLLWEEPAVKEVYRKYRTTLQLPDSAHYFFDNVKRFCDPSYKPNKEDILNIRARTTGVLETDIEVEGALLRFVDVGGQKNERSKWIHCFENVTAVIFIVAISEFDQVMFEDDVTNRIQDSMREFETTVNKHFPDRPIILFFNKRDVLEDKLKSVQLSDHFPEFKEENTFKNVFEHFKRKYLELNKNPERQIYCYETCAKDSENVHTVFQTIKKIVLDSILKEATILIP